MTELFQTRLASIVAASALVAVFALTLLSQAAQIVA